MPSIPTALRAVHKLGLRPTLLYALYQLGLRSGWLQLRTPVSTWEKAFQDYQGSLHPGAPPDSPRVGLFQPSVPGLRQISGWETQALRKAESILSGRFTLFGQTEEIDIGFPPSWNRQPAFDSYPRSQPLKSTLHWSRVSTSGVTDIKYIWELSRFSWVYTLGRAYAASGDQCWFDGFIHLLDSWCAGNPPNAGPQWISGQEVALRLLAVIFAMDAFADELEGRPVRARNLRAFLAVHASRLPSTLLYARAQGNNHLISEALGLYAAGAALPEHRSAHRWRKLGRRWLVQAIGEQVFQDGGYVQHSHTYARLALQEGLLGAVLAAHLDEPLPADTLTSLSRMAGLLRAMADPQTGHVPNFGSNDGALFLPLTAQPIRDFRPTLQAAHAVLDGRRLYPRGPWDELAVWLGAGEVLEDDRSSIELGGESASGSSFPDAGLYVLDGGESSAVLRCARFQGRPNHSDQLHMDLRWRGAAMAMDAGTYLYNAPEPWNNSLVGAAVHNTMTVNSQDPMLRAGRFLLLDWAQGEMLMRTASADSRFELISAQHGGYRSLGMMHRRTVLRVGSRSWFVIDDLFLLDESRFGSDPATVRLAWLLPDYPLDVRAAERSAIIQMSTASGPVKLDISLDNTMDDQGTSNVGVAHEPGDRMEFSIYRGGECVHGESGEAHPSWGWFSSTYGEKTPANLVSAIYKGSLPVRFMSRWLLEGDVPGLTLDLRAPGGTSCAVRSLEYGEVVWQPGAGGEASKE